MKLTIKQIKQLVRKELKESYENEFGQSENEVLVESMNEMMHMFNAHIGALKSHDNEDIVRMAIGIKNTFKNLIAALNNEIEPY